MFKNLKFKILNPQTQTGFTLVEVLVTTMIFSLLMIDIGGIFVQIMNLERRGFAAQKIQENGTFVLETISREVRVSRIENQDNSNCTATTLTIAHPVNGTVVYSVNGGIVQRQATEGGQPITTAISSSDVNFTRFNFCIAGSDPNDNKQARVAVVASIQNRTGKEIYRFDVQTTVSSRDVSTEFQN
jgi:prepilin-type N-terminal cleavage/methylation domain-containing protein